MKRTIAQDRADAARDAAQTAEANVILGPNAKKTKKRNRLDEDTAPLLCYDLQPQIDGPEDNGLFSPEQYTYARQLHDIDARCTDAIAFYNERSRDDHSNESAAEVRKRQRREAGKKTALVNFVQIAANVETTPDKVLSVLSGLPSEIQHRVAALAQRHADLEAIRKILTTSQREKRLSPGVVDILQAIGRGTPQTRRRLADLKSEAQAEELADMVAKWREEAKRMRTIDWQKQQRFEQAQAIQRTGDIEEIVKRFRALPYDPKQTVLATLICESEEALA